MARFAEWSAAPPCQLEEGLARFSELEDDVGSGRKSASERNAANHEQRVAPVLIDLDITLTPLCRGRVFSACLTTVHRLILPMRSARSLVRHPASRFRANKKNSKAHHRRLILA